MENFKSWHVWVYYEKVCTLDIPEADVSGVDLEVEVLVILVYSNNFSYLKLSVQKVGQGRSYW